MLAFGDLLKALSDQISPQEWVVAFQTFAIDDKKMAFEKLFKSLDQQDLRR